MIEEMPDQRAEVFGVERDGVHQREERDPYRAGPCWSTKEFRWAAFLDSRLLGVNDRQERGCRVSLHSGQGREDKRLEQLEIMAF